MIAKELDSCYGDFTNVEVADKYAKMVIKDAEYMERQDKWTVLFHPTILDPIGNFVYEINGKRYTTTLTNKHSELVEHYEKEMKKPEQMSIFDF